MDCRVLELVAYGILLGTGCIIVIWFIDIALVLIESIYRNLKGE